MRVSYYSLRAAETTEEQGFVSARKLDWVIDMRAISRIILLDQFPCDKRVLIRIISASLWETLQRVFPEESICHGIIDF